MATRPVTPEDSAQRIRDELTKAKEGGYFPNGACSYIDPRDIENVVRTVIGPDPYVAKPSGIQWTSADGEIKLTNTHPPELCEGRGCVLHHPSGHHMVEWPLNWRTGGMFDIKPPHFERICPHGIGHPDPDSAAYWKENGHNVGVHGCDGCCHPPSAGRLEHRGDTATVAP